MKKTRRLSLLTLLLASTAFAQLKTPKSGFNLFSKEQDVQLGREAAAQIERQVQVVRDSDLQGYVNDIGRRLASTPEAGGFPYTFKVVNDPNINAFALPGGPTYVHSGLIKAADNEAQLAGVMAHEIAHVALRHGTNQASKANLIQLPAMIAGAMVGNGSMLGQLAQLGVGLGANSVLLKFSRNAERDADLLGANMMAKAGYNPVEMARFFEKLEAQGGSRGPQFLASHPNPGNRVKYVSEQVRYLPQQNYHDGDSGGFRRAQQLASGLPNPGKGSLGNGRVAEGNPMPSGRMSEYRAQTFAIAHPDNWETFGDPQSAVVTIAPRSGLAQDNNGGVQILYGVMAGYHVGDGRQEDLRRDTDELVSQLLRTNPGMQVERKQRNVRIGGGNGLVTMLYGTSPYRGEREQNTLVTVMRPEGLFYMVFITPESGARQLSPTFDQMLRSVRFSR